jgi:hypothetical protein
MPAYTATRKAPLGSGSMLPRCAVGATVRTPGMVRP